MMILDDIKNLSNYPCLKKVQAFLEEIAGKDLDKGKYPIDDDCYVSVSAYDTKESLGLFEGHLKYIDVQLVLDGEEYIQVCDKRDATVATDYNETKDVQFFSAEKWHNFYVGKNTFLLLDEQDLHRPCVAITKSAPVKKYIFKIKK